MDTTQINTVEWFFGYGGNHLGLKRVIPNMRLLAVCEREGYACANMVAKMEAGLLDSAPIWTDAKTFPSGKFYGLVDLFVASYPRQGFSCAGKREGSRDPRFLWPWVYRFVIEARPSVVFFENVEGHVSLGLSSCVSDLEEAGYTVAPGIFSAEECGATHRRKRVFILGYDTKFRWREGGPPWPGGLGQSTLVQSSDVADAQGVGEREQDDAERAEPRQDARENAGGRGDELGDALGAGLEGRSSQPGGNGEKCTSAKRTSLFWPSAPARPGEPQHAWEPPRVIKTVGGLGVLSDGAPSGLDQGEIEYEKRCKERAFEVLSGVRSQANSKTLQRASGGFLRILAEEILRAGVRLDILPERIAIAVSSAQTCTALQKAGVRDVWRNNDLIGPPFGFESCEQLTNELDDALRLLSHEMALGKRKVYPASVNIDELRLLGNGVYPACAAKAFVTLAKKLFS